VKCPVAIPTQGVAEFLKGIPFKLKRFRRLLYQTVTISLKYFLRYLFYWLGCHMRSKPIYNYVYVNRFVIAWVINCATNYAIMYYNE